MASYDIAPGDVVVLRSGGPMMTVTEVSADNLSSTIAWCTWFDEAKILAQHFPVAALKKHEFGS